VGVRVDVLALRRPGRRVDRNERRRRLRASSARRGRGLHTQRRPTPEQARLDLGRPCADEPLPALFFAAYSVTEQRDFGGYTAYRLAPK